jgi:hypothetical protein
VLVLKLPLGLKVGPAETVMLLVVAVVVGEHLVKSFDLLQADGEVFLKFHDNIYNQQVFAIIWSKFTYTGNAKPRTWKHLIHLENLLHLQLSNEIFLTK